MERARTLSFFFSFFFSLFEGRRGWIDIDGFRWKRWFSKLGTCPTFFPLFPPCRLNGMLLQVLMTISTKSLTVKTLFSFTFVFPFFGLGIYLFFSKVEKFQTFIILKVSRHVKSIKMHLRFVSQQLNRFICKCQFKSLFAN